MADDKRTKSIDDVLAHVSHMRRGMLKALLAGAAGVTALPLMTTETLAGDNRSYSKTELERLGENGKGKKGKGKNAKGKAGDGKTGKGEDQPGLDSSIGKGEQKKF